MNWRNWRRTKLYSMPSWTPVLLINVMDHNFCTCESCIIYLLRKSIHRELYWTTLTWWSGTTLVWRAPAPVYCLLFADAVPGIALGCNCSTLYSLSVFMLFSCLGSSCECALIGMSRKSARIAASLMCFRGSLSNSGCSGVPLLLISLLLKVVWLKVMSEIPSTLQRSS